MSESRGNEMVEKNINVFKYGVMDSPPPPNPCSFDDSVPEGDNFQKLHS
jgi:hypothetical protein